MPSRKGSIVLGLGALFAAPLLWSLSAEAKSISCGVANGTGGLFAYTYQTYSIRCEGAGMVLGARARADQTDHNGVEVALTISTGTTGASATTFGYNASQLYIPGCAVTDYVTGIAFKNLECDDTVKFVSLSAAGTAP